MSNYELRVVPKVDENNNTYWTAFYPAIPGCVGGGSTIEEAVDAAKENLDIYLEYLEEEKIKKPHEYEEPKYSGKIALRISKSSHKQIAEFAQNDGVSINSYINTAIDNYLGKKQYDYGLENKINELKEIAETSLKIQYANALINTQNANMQGYNIPNFINNRR